MLVFGDRVRTEDPREMLRRLSDALQPLEAMAAGIERHGRLASLYIAAGEVAQGVADAEFARRGEDVGSPLQDGVMAMLVELARALWASWSSGFHRVGALPINRVERLSRGTLPESVSIKRAEGYAFYALYPEAYAAAAQALDATIALRVIGIRSIGAGLAAMVAAPRRVECLATVRPVGHPFQREVRVNSALAARLLDGPDAQFAIVDEGPGLSGSSFGAVADFLEANGAPASRIHFFPGHAGDLGPQASPRHRERWRSARRHGFDFDRLVLHSKNPVHRLERWVASLVGEPLAPLEDISGGAWRRHRFANVRDWPAAHIHQERRKFLLRTESGVWLLKFAGLGADGERKLKPARQLHAAGFAPEVAGVRHGFLVERWLGDARPLEVSTIARGGLVRHLASYMAFRAEHFAARPEEGASLAELGEMARYNAAQALGEEAAGRLERWRGRLSVLAHRVRPIETDNRMHAWEWLQTPDGRVVKTDALDHHAAHDLVGCQDVAWDVAGTTVEFALSAAEQNELCAVVEREGGCTVDRELLAFLTPCYLAFQLGSFTMAADALAGVPDEATRLRTMADRYAERLRAELGREAPGQG